MYCFFEGAEDSTKVSKEIFHEGFLGGGLKDFLCSPLFGEDFPNLTNIFQIG